MVEALARHQHDAISFALTVMERAPWTGIQVPKECAQSGRLATSTRDLAHLATMLAPPSAHAITLGGFSIPVVTSEAMAEGDWRLVSDGEVAR